MGFLVKIFNLWILESGGRETLEGEREKERERERERFVGM